MGYGPQKKSTTIRTFSLSLGWLVMLVLRIAVPLGLDAVGRLTYFTSLAFWGIPILYLWPVFNMLTAEGTGWRRRALRFAVGTIVVLGICGVCRPCMAGSR